MDPSSFAAISSSSSSSSPTVIRQNYPALTLDASLFMDTSLDTSTSFSTPTRKQSVFDNPLDTRYAVPISSSSNTGGGSLTEFTKRKNWSQRIIDELKDFLHVLSPNGKIMYCAPSSLELVGYAPEELVGRIITDFIHIDDIDIFVREFNMAIHTRRDFKLYYRFRKKDDKFIVFEVTGHPYFSEGSAVAKCFFAMAQPYPTKATSMLDSFLELKIENERLRHRLRDLRASRNEKSQSSTDPDPASASHPSPSPSLSLPLPPLPPHPALPLLSPPLNTTDDMDILDASLTYPSHRPSNDTILKFTGMRYSDGERSTGISTGSVDARLTNDPVEIVGPASSVATATATATATDTTSEEKKPPRKKKPKTEEDEYVCTDCGTTESPEWRKGPSGPKTLCNACGLRWAKKNKKIGGEGEGDGE